ncbi:MAG: ABC transporter ATP-binding protein [Desulfobacteraceae bacterium]|nr:ABC transporter ATP-binding protein [Desulfobacteraceae bacterium]
MKVKPNTNLLDVKGMKIHFHSSEGVAKAVDGISFHLDRGEVLGIVGESGCGKSVTAKSIMRLIPTPPGKIAAGQIIFDGTDLLKLSIQQMRRIRGNRIAMIFQEPMTSLNPVFTIGDQISEMFILHRGLRRKQALEQAVEMLAKVQIPEPCKRSREYPHQLSGGMRQRAMIAMALACDPQILIADEPTTALDVTIQAQIIDLMLQLKEDFHTSIIMITHDLGVIAEIAQTVAVMYAGKIVEQAPAVDLFDRASHPYTQGLLKSIPKLGRRAAKGRCDLSEIPGIVPSLYRLPQGCSFYPRCEKAHAVCNSLMPDLHSVSEHHRVRCWLYADKGKRKD